MPELPEGTELLSQMSCTVRTVRIIAERHQWSDAISLYGRVYSYSDSCGPFDVIDLVTMKSDKTMDSVVEPFIHIGSEQSQELMDTLWNAGIRPSEELRHQVDDSHRHLDDMRKIAFATLKKLEIDVG